MKQARQKVFNVIRDDDENTISGTIFDTIIIIFILVNVLFVILDTFHLGGTYTIISRVVEIVTAVVFTVEYALRIWTAPLMYPGKRPAVARLKWIFTFMALVDLLSILPVYLPLFVAVPAQILLSLRVIRLVRLFKLGRYTDAFSIILFVLRRKSCQIISSTMMVFVLLTIASVMMYSIESEVQPDKFDNAFSSFWWTVSTVTTIGYGDLYPVTTAGKILGMVIALLGVALIAIPTGIISAGFVEASGLKHRRCKNGRWEIIEEPEEPVESKQYCPHCGKKLE